MLPENSILGELRVVSVYDYDNSYYFPVLFSCKNEKDEFYLAIFVDKIDSSYLFLYTRIEDTDTLILLENPKFIVPEEYYVDTKLKIYKVVAPESTVTEISSEEVPFYLADYCEQRQKDIEYFTKFIKELD